MTTKHRLLAGAASLILGAAGAQAADLPGKAAPAEYVRVCDTYGVGFFFIPGTDTCLRIGGFVRADFIASTNPGNRVNNNPNVPGAQVLGTSFFDQNYATAVRLTLNVDARSNTEYGLLRAFGQFSAYRGPFSGTFSSQGLVNSGAGQSPRASAINVERAFIQFAGFTAGFSASFFNFYQGDVQLSGNFAATARSTTVLAYTASFGSGLSATVSIEDSMYRRYGNGDSWYGAAGPAGTIMSSSLQRPLSGRQGMTYAGQQIPDIVANLRVDQGWGSAQVMGALHQLRDFGYAGIVNVPTARAGDKMGWAVGAGLRINLDMLARGDVLWLQAVYTDGALSYAFDTQNQGGDREGIYGAGNSAAVNALNSLLRDAAVTASTGGAPLVGNAQIRTTKAWSLAAGLRHFWTPALRSSIFGAYSNIDQPGGSTLNDVKYWNVGVNTIWSPVRNLDLGVEVVYHNIRARTQSGGIPVISPSNTFRGQEGAWVGMVRVQRNF
ncbi:porin [Phreatobacter sp. AB_2022a]|uniref:porin n=1 Tax=Phreatobacter sp. AB_2022a TaxID=3003134 RepID=UPI002286ED60|nr:porin [Phreatobacter sp. AB_2022a]MCZ0736619.1 porin [Phreatobacter sp. AB_2022a]